MTASLARQQFSVQLTRRQLLQAGGIGALTLALPGTVTASVETGRGLSGGAADRSCIFVLLCGGPSHIDTWDLKPGAPAEYRGDFKPIPTNVSGIQVSEHLPLSAQQMDRFSILRSVTHPDAGHESASHYLLTGYRPTNDIPSNEVPSYGSIVAKERGPRRPGLPAYLAVPTPPRSTAAAYLGVGYNPFSVGSDPSAASFSVRNLTLPNGISMSRLENRRRLLQSIDTMRRATDQTGLMD